ncbi:hypothetical protein HDU97_002048 [Phlyctochytrium planicorne]|nr:hypothetical protein HDU97_002048 [Phlyctochytrium planicorne]
MSGVLESQRRVHEELERLEDAMVKAFLEKPKTQKEKLLQQHRLLKILDLIQGKSQQLLDSYQDQLRNRKSEISAITAVPGQQEFSEFYARLKSTKDYHRRFNNELAEPFDSGLIPQYSEKDEEGTTSTGNNRAYPSPDLDILFSGEENLGKFLDLNEVFVAYINLKGVKSLNYLAYLNEFDNFENIPAETRKSSAYAKYLETMVDYLEGFLKRSRPLFDLDAGKASIRKRVEEEWQNNVESDSLFCQACTLKSWYRNLMISPGQKHFAKKSVYDGHLSGKKHIKASEALKSTDLASLKSNSQRESQLAVAIAEALVLEYSGMLSSQKEETRMNIERKQSLTIKERMVDAEEDVEEELIVSDDEDEEKIYNPLKLPLGWDGKPIPYWLYKLHGLGVEYTCEICGNYVYMGRKAFERHFQEWRHGHGMRCLGIPNTRHFHEITQIADAYALWEKLQSTAKSESFKADAMEEFEDAEGNVFNKKTFEDLRRQGLL